MDDHASPQQTAEEYVAAQKARYIADVRETAPSIADVMQRAVEHMSRDEMQAELSRLRKELAEAVAAHNAWRWHLLEGLVLFAADFAARDGKPMTHSVMAGDYQYDATIWPLGMAPDEVRENSEDAR